MRRQKSECEVGSERKIGCQPTPSEEEAPEEHLGVWCWLKRSWWVSENPFYEEAGMGGARGMGLVLITTRTDDGPDGQRGTKKCGAIRLSSASLEVPRALKI